MGMKSRGNWSVNCCLRRCANRDIKCGECLRFSQYLKFSDYLNEILEKEGNDVND